MAEQPYFVPGEALFAALRPGRDAPRRCASVAAGAPGPPHRFRCFQPVRLQALRADVRVFRYQPGFLHPEGAADRPRRLLGSANLDNRSLRLNFEVSLLTFDEGFNAQVATMLEDDFSRSRRLVNADQRNLHRLQQLGMRVARLISPIL